MSAYGDGFARVYDAHWGVFAETVSPLVLARLRRRRPGVELRVLDLGCGTGITAALLEAAGCAVTGVDGSSAMLAVARRRTGARTTLVQGELHQPPAGRYDAVVCLFDTLNHLGGLNPLRAVLSAAAGAASPGAMLLFDLNTHVALRTWDFTDILDGDPPVTVSGRCDPNGAWAEMTVSVTSADEGAWVEVQREVAYDLSEVARLLEEVGWGRVRWTTYDDLTTRLERPELNRRVVGECTRAR